MGLRVKSSEAAAGESVSLSPLEVSVHNLALLWPQEKFTWFVLSLLGLIRKPPQHLACLR